VTTNGNVTELSAWAGLATSHVSDALDRFGIAGQAMGIMPLDRGFRLLGRAYTVRYVPCGQNGGSVGDYIEDVPPGSIVVLDNAGRMDSTVWGEILTITANHLGVAGTVIDGICRDTDESIARSYPIFARGRWMRTGKDRVCVAEYRGPISVGDVHVEQEDLLIGDADGVVVVPAHRVSEILDAATEIHDRESLITDSVLSGNTLRAAREEFGYHQLQARI
jgi:4-hydroxy-4-methyl-2-oxoglutarate aldolase